MKTIRANVDLEGRVSLAFGWDKELVDFVKEVSGFSWVKATHQWKGALHSLAALEYAAKKRGDIQIAIGWPSFAAPPVILQSNFTLRDYQTWIVGVLLTRREFLLCWSPRVGKAQPFDAGVLTPSGWRHIGDLEVGDLVISPSGGSVPVTGVFPQGVRDVYRVETSDGASTECCAEHLWTVQTHKLKGTTGNWVTRPLSWLIERNALTSDRRHRWYLPLCVSPTFDFDRKKLGLEPYVIGALLGNGSFNDNGTVAFTCADEEVVTRIRSCLPALDELRQRGPKTNEFSFSTQRPGRTTVARFIEDAGLRSKEAHEKFVPREFFLVAPGDRLALLQGLLDTDGDTPANSSTVVFNSASEQLRDDVIELVRSLGGFASKGVKEEPHYTYKDEARTGRPSYRAYIRLGINPFSLSRKAKKWRAGPMARGVQSVKSVGRKPVLCISVGSEDGLYVTDGYIVTHNTTAVIHAAATATATRVIERTIVIPPANVTSEWSRQLGQAFPGMSFFELEGQPLETDKRKGNFAKTIENEVKKAREKKVASAEKAFKKKWAKAGTVPPTAEQLASCHPTEAELAEREQEIRDRYTKKWGAAVEIERGLLAAASTAHFVACQHDLVAPRAETLAAVADLGPFALCVDEVQLFTDEKAPRSKALIALAKHKNCRKVWLTSGTPMRNRPEDLVVFYELVGGIGSGKWGYLKRYCNPPEAPIWMGDFSFKPLGDVRIGDEVIGWRQEVNKHSKLVLTRTRVTNVMRHVASIVRVEFESGRWLRCTADHLWMVNNGMQAYARTSRNIEIQHLFEAGLSFQEIATRFELSVPYVQKLVTRASHQFNVVKVGRRLNHVIDATPCALPTAHLWLSGWLAGMYDGEGSRNFISQSSKANPGTWAMLGHALAALGIPHTLRHDNDTGSNAGGAYILGGRKGFQEFLRRVRPTRDSSWEKVLLGSKFRTADRIKSVTPDGSGEVIGLTTETGNYIAWGYASKNCNAFESEYGWQTNGEANLDEAAARFASVSHRLTREDVKKDLPAIDRKVTLCPLSREEGQRYKALEAALGKKAMQGFGSEKTQALRTLVSSVLAVKLETALERVLFHVAQRGQKVLVGANFHESLQAFAELISARFPGSPFYVAGGWLGPDKRTAIVDAWKADPRPTPLLVNVLSSGVGIDLSDAEGTIVLEIPWVPSDALQFEARILDVHLGKRTSPPWVEYLLAAGTVDEDMALANLKKIGVVDQVVGGERESRALANALRDSGVVSQVDLGLTDKSDSAVEAALDGLRRRLSGQAAAPEASGLSTAALVGAVEEAFDGEEEDDQQRAERDFTLADVGG